MSNLTTFLEIAYAGPAARKDIVERKIPKELSADAYGDGKVYKVRDLVLSEAIESTTLIQTEVFKTVVEGAEPYKAAREALWMVPMSAQTMRINYGESGTYAPTVAEAAEIPIDTQDYTPVTLTAEKYAVRPVITREMMADALFPVVELELKKAGMRIENALNQQAVNTLLEGSGTEHDTAGSNQGVKAVVKAVGALKALGFTPSSAIIHPEAEAIIMADFQPGYNAMAEQSYRAGLVPNIYGINFYTIGTADVTGGTYTWDYDSDGDIGMMVFDKYRAGVIGMREDMSIENYKDPIRDLEGMVVKSRFDCATIISTATCRVEY